MIDRDDRMIRKIIRNHPDWTDEQVENAWKEGYGVQPNKSRSSGSIIIIILAVAAVLGLLHENQVLQSRNNPPVACILGGGEWNPLTGWNC